MAVAPAAVRLVESEADVAALADPEYPRRPARPDDPPPRRVERGRGGRQGPLPRAVDPRPLRPLLRDDQPPGGPPGDRRPLRRRRRDRLGELLEHRLADPRRRPRSAARGSCGSTPPPSCPTTSSGVVGLTAGASAPEWLVEEVLARLDPAEGVEIGLHGRGGRVLPPAPRPAGPAQGGRGGRRRRPREPARRRAGGRGRPARTGRSHAGRAARVARLLTFNPDHSPPAPAGTKGPDERPRPAPRPGGGRPHRRAGARGAGRGPRRDPARTRGRRDRLLQGAGQHRAGGRRDPEAALRPRRLGHRRRRRRGGRHGGDRPRRRPLRRRLPRQPRPGRGPPARLPGGPGATGRATWSPRTPTARRTRRTSRWSSPPVVAGEADFVNGSRRLGTTLSRGAVRNFGVSSSAQILSLLTRTRVTDTTNPIRAFPAELTEHLDARRTPVPGLRAAHRGDHGRGPLRGAPGHDAPPRLGALQEGRRPLLRVLLRPGLLLDLVAGAPPPAGDPR